MACEDQRGASGGMHFQVPTQRAMYQGSHQGSNQGVTLSVQGFTITASSSVRCYSAMLKQCSTQGCAQVQTKVSAESVMLFA